MGFDLDNNTMITLMILILGITFVVIFCVCLYGNNKMGPSIWKIFRDKFKGQAIKTLIKSFNESLEYEPNSYIPQEVYEKAEFGAFETYWSEDLIYGKTENNCEFRMAEVLTGVRSNERFNTIFEGMFAVIETPKPFNQVIHIRENNQKVKFSPSAKPLRQSDLKQFALDKEELYKYYRILDFTLEITNLLAKVIKDTPY